VQERVRRTPLLASERLTCGFDCVGHDRQCRAVPPRASGLVAGRGHTGTGTASR
jgi:hypothetical protein